MTTTPTGAALRTGPFRPGDKVQLTDSKGRMTTITLETGALWHTHRGSLAHDDIIGLPEGSVVTAALGTEYLALRPLLSDVVLAMPRGAAVIYPKDAGQIVTMTDIYPGANVIEAGVGSGGLTLSLLNAVGDAGRLLSIERRPEFAEIAEANVDSFFGTRHPAWQVALGDFDDVTRTQVAEASVDRVILDMLAPWENIDAAARVLAPGGVLCAYVATTTQMSRFAEDLKTDGRWTESEAWENMVRGWHLEGLAVRPQHRMVGHTGFLVMTRRLAPGVVPPMRSKRPAPGAYSEPILQVPEEQLAADLGERELTAKRLRRVRRDQDVITDAQTAAQTGELAGSNAGDVASSKDGAEDCASGPTQD